MNKRFNGSSSVFLLLAVGGGFALPLAAQLPPELQLKIDSLNEVQVAAVAQQLAGTAQVYRNLAELQLHNAQSLRAGEEVALTLLKADTLAAKEKIATLEKNFKSAKNAEKVAQKNFKQSEKTLVLAESTPTMDSLLRRKNVTKVQQQLTELQRLLYPPPAETPPALVTTPADSAAIQRPTDLPPVKRDKKPELPGKKYKTYDPQADVMLHPPIPPCALAMDRRDEFSGELQREAARTELFRFTNPVLKTYLQGNSQILCEAALTTFGQSASLLLTFTIRDPNGRKAFGNLPKNGVATLQTLDGTLLTLNNQQLGEGVADEAGQVFTFRGHYPLDRIALKKLRSSGLDKLRIAWATGYEDYEVQNVDLLIQQAKCLEP